MKKKLLIGVFALLLSTSFAKVYSADLIETMNSELMRSFNALQKEQIPPYLFDSRYVEKDFEQLLLQFG